jgi:hypothetical protein
MAGSRFGYVTLFQNISLIRPTSRTAKVTQLTAFRGLPPALAGAGLGCVYLCQIMPLGHLISGAPRATQLTALGVFAGVGAGIEAGIAASLDIIG